MLELIGISKSFGGIQALKEISFSVEKGSIVAIIGPNGAGKTTLINMISGFVQPDEGEIRVDGKASHRLKSHEIAKLGVGRTFQNLELFQEMTVLENVIIGFHLASTAGLWQVGFRFPSQVREERLIREKAMKILAEVGLAGQANLGVDCLSAGQQRILEIVRALSQDPTYLLLDEPFAGLSAQECLELGKSIRNRKEEGRGIILVEHNMDAVMSLADRIVCVDYGRVIAEGTPEEIRAHAGVIAAYLGEEL